MADYTATIKHAATKYNIPYGVLHALLNQESGLTMGKTSTAGARDIAQFMPATAKAYGVTLGDGNATDDIMGAAHYLQDNLKRTGGDIRGALSIYNSGRPDTYKDPNFSGGQTYNYVRSIMSAAGNPRSTTERPGSSPTTPGGSYQSVNVPGTTDPEAKKAALLAWMQNRHLPGATTTLLDALKAAKTPGSTQVYQQPGQSSTDGSSPSGSSKLLELFWQGAGGIDAKDGVKVPQGFVSGHKDHVHVAAGPKTVVQLGKLAQSLGLNVGGNSNFNGGTRVTSGHAPNSYHYKDEAIDVSGDAKAMQHYAALVAHKYGLKVNG